MTNRLRATLLQTVPTLLLIGCIDGVHTEIEEGEQSVAGVVVDTAPTYTIHGVGSGKCLQAVGGSTANAVAIEIRTCDGSRAQQFRLDRVTGERYAIRNVQSDRCLDVLEYSTADAAAVIQYDCAKDVNQQWTFGSNNGAYNVTAYHSGKVLDVSGASGSDGARVIQYRWRSMDNQRFNLVDVSGGTGGTGGSGTGGSGTGGSGAGSTDCQGGDYYVATNGNDSNPGTIDRPFATLQKAIDMAGPGDLVYVRGGTYRIRKRATASAGVHFHKSGTSDTNRIRYFACPGEVPAFDFADLEIRPDPSYTTGFVVNGAWLHLKGFEVRNMPMNTRSNTAVGVSGGAHDDIFELLNMHHNNGSGMFIDTTTGGHQVINCDSHDNYDPRSHQGDGQNADGFGVHYQKTGKATIFRGCRAWWNSDDGWDFISQEVPVIVENSWAYGNGYTDSGRSRPPSGNGNGFKIGSSKTGIRHVVRSSLAWGNRASGFYANHSAGGNDWFNNTSYNNGTQFNMLASRWDSDDNRTDGVVLTGDKVHRMRNNISFPLDNTNMQGVDERSNSWNLRLTPSSSDFVSVDDTGTLGARQPDGRLPDLDFLKLRDDSRMIDKGTDVGLPYSGSAPDLGAYER